MNFDPNIRVGIALPCTDDTFPAPFVDSFFCMTKPSHAYLRPQTGGPIDTVRNELIEKALHAACTHIFMCDTDQVYAQDVLQRLLSHKLPVVTAKVHRGYPPYDPILLRGEINNFKNVADKEWWEGGLVEVDATGMGCALIDMEVIESIEAPWFKWVIEPGKKPIGEDIYFWSQVKKAGYKIYVDCDAKIGHIRNQVILEESYWAYKNAQSFVTPTN